MGAYTQKVRSSILPNFNDGIPADHIRPLARRRHTVYHEQSIRIIIAVDADMSGCSAETAVIDGAYSTW
jgi:hypothetical protein